MSRVSIGTYEALIEALPVCARRKLLADWYDHVEKYPGANQREFALSWAAAEGYLG